ncbi:MAG: nitroreductase family protein [Syntrophomonadaceae bacterium]|nr:nitroreductase family protein [Syntrophomonadaceae bacterium]MDH7496975.1 nitroreductase family protein [Syntrophomonadaceae bacterium]
METREAIFGRRSIRKYLPRPIDPQVLHDIMEGALMAPSAVNTQPWYFVVVQSQDRMERLKAIFSRVSADTRASLEQRFPRHPEVVNDTMGFIRTLGEAPVCVLVFALKPDDGYALETVQSISAAIQNLCLMAYDHGIGSCWMTAPLTTGYGPLLEKEFAPGAGRFMAAVTLGYPAVIPRAPRRKPGRYCIV